MEEIMKQMGDEKPDLPAVDSAGGQTGGNAEGTSQGSGSQGGGVRPGHADSFNGIMTVGGNDDNQFQENVIHILNGVIGALGLVCVVVMIIGGINYITSAGDTNKVDKGKKTIIYGLIGLIICVLAFAVVNFVISNIIGGGE